MDPAYHCPRCGSDDTASLAATHAHGTSRSAGLLVGGRLGLGGLASTATTDAAAAAAPPEPMPVEGARFVFVVGCALFVAAAGGYLLLPIADPIKHPRDDDGTRLVVCVIAAVVGAALAVASLYLRRKWQRQNAAVYAPALARWRQTWTCRRCGAAFVPAEPAPPPAATVVRRVGP